MPMPDWNVYIDWDNDGTYAGRDDVTLRRRADDMSIQYGRDSSRALAPTAPGQAAFILDNDSRDYSPENTSSPLYGKVLPSRPVQITGTHLGTTYHVFNGFTDDFVVQPGPGQRSASVSCIDALGRLAGAKISTPLSETIRTGKALHNVLDEIDWPEDKRDIDPGATIIRFWWEEDTDAMTAVQRIVQSEGLPAFFTVNELGEFVFRDRHHRFFYSGSYTSQKTIRDKGTDPRFSWPLVYESGWRDVVNSVRISVSDRKVDAAASVVWESDVNHYIEDGETLAIHVDAGEPFKRATIPVAGSDYRLVYGTVNVTLERDSGQATTIYVTATGGAAFIGYMRLRAFSVPNYRTRLVAKGDAGSRAEFGKRDPEEFEAPWASYEDAKAIASVMLAHRAWRLPTVTIRLTGGNDTIITQQLVRNLSDRITIVDTETGINAPFYIHRIEHTISGAGAQLFETLFYCEKALTQPANVFRFNTSGQGFNDGLFAIDGLDDVNTIFRFDTSGHGFNDGFFAT